MLLFLSVSLVKELSVVRTVYCTNLSVSVYSAVSEYSIHHNILVWTKQVSTVLYIRQ